MHATLKAALITGSALALSISAAQAASMAKAGMDKRVADLEREITLMKSQVKQVMMAKPADKNIVSGNSRVKVTIYGQVNKAVRVSSSDGNTEFDVVDNDGSSSRIGIRAVGKVDKNISIVGWHELEWQYNRRSATGDEGNERVRARHVDLMLNHNEAGQIHIGRGSIAGDAADLISLSGVGHVFGTAGHAADGTKATRDGEGSLARGWRTFAFFGARENRIMYVTPPLMGARVRLSYGENDSFSAGLRYGGSPMGKGLRAMLWVGYRQDPNEHDDSKARRTAWGLSAGIKHVGSGLSVSGNYSTERNKGSNARPSAWFAEIGWSTKDLIDGGATQLAVGYGKFNDDMYTDSRQIWAAVNQNLDAAAADVYAGIAVDSGDAEAEGEDLCGDAGKCSAERDNVLIFIAGARVKF